LPRSRRRPAIAWLRPRAFAALTSPSAVTEPLYFSAAEYGEHPGYGGGLKDEGEDIEVLEIPFDEAYAMIGHGRIVDAKTILLLQFAKPNVFAGDQGCAVR